MRSQKLSGAVLIVIFLFGHLTFVQSGQQLPRFLQNVNTGHHGSSHAICGPDQCVHGSCSFRSHFGVETYYCTCHHGWIGEACDKPTAHISSTSNCGSHSCVHGSCSHDRDKKRAGVTSYTCTCQDGWTGKSCDQTVARDGQCRHASDCTSMACDEGDKVICYVGAVCACAPRSQRLRRFLEMGGNHMPVGGGFHMPTATNVCGPYKCAHGSCTYREHNDVVMYHTCTCNHGWTGDECDSQIGSHASNQGYCGQHPCIHGSCSVNTDTGLMAYHTCSCNDGWTGDACDKQKVSSTTTRHYDSECNNQGHMMSSGCYCHDNWSGDICQYPPGYGHHDHCNNDCAHGTCVGHSGDQGYYFDCKCDKGWHGDHCTQSAVSTTTTQRHYDSECNNNGQMTSSGCNCHDNWSGDICQYPPGYGHHDHCNNNCANGTCVGHLGNQGYYFNCKCNQGWHGYHCTQYAPPGSVQCHNSYCMHGTCRHHQDHHGYWHYYCRCNNGWDGQHCEQQLTSTSVPPTTLSASSTSTRAMTSSTTTATSTAAAATTTPAPTNTTRQTTLPPASATTFPATSSTPLSTTVTTASISTAAPLTTCDHISTLSAIARQVHVANQNAIECSPGNHTSHEAFVLTECAVPQIPSSWQQGINVMTDCGSSASIPSYTPIAAFDHGLYSSVGSLSGIFLGCTSNGFKIALQTCGQTPSIAELQLGGSNTQNPNMYYTIS